MSASREAQLQRYAELLRKWNPAINLVAPATLDDLEHRHIKDSAQLAELVTTPGEWLDIGSGGGLPGLIVAICQPDRPLTLVLVGPMAAGKTSVGRKAARLLDEAGWKVGSDGIRRNDKNETLKVEFLNANQSFDRIINPFVQNLRAVGIDATNARVDDAEMETRTRSHDFDIVTDSLGQSFYMCGGTEQYFGSENVGDVFNSMGLANPAIDQLMKLGIAATTQEEMDNIIKAFDRSLRALRFWVPQWYKADYTLAYYDMYAHPDTMPPYALGELDFWWYDADKAEKLKQAGALR